MKKAVFVCFVFAAALLFLNGQLQAGTAKQTLGDRHKTAGIECNQCHGQDVKEIIPNGKCLVCHGSFEKLGEQTKDMPLNPHKSPHFMDLECTSCHQGHAGDQNFCQTCHGPIARAKAQTNN